ncbi:MAG: VWA domain-containing protein [Deltaproteobacteria bacterium]|nr:VWA domain-containing protein [Deltaproteobacteria bacterium]
MEATQEQVTQGSLRTRDGRALPLLHTVVEASVSGPVADVVVRQRFRNDGTEPIEAVYLFPLPHEASVYRMLFRLEDREVVGVVKEKAEARRAYQEALSQGRAATLLEEDRPSLFTLSVANVAPGVELEVELAYQEVLSYDDGLWRLVFPMVAPERYRDGPAPAPGAALPPPRLPSGERGADVSLAVTVTHEEPLEALRSPSHKVHVDTAEAGRSVVRLDTAGAVANRDFVLSWRAGAAGVRPLLRVERKAGKSGHFLLVVTPSAPRDSTERSGGRDELKALKCGNCGGVVSDLSQLKDIPGLGPVVPCGFCGAVLTPGTEAHTRATRPRDVLILVDRSASMRGSLGTCALAVDTVLRALDPADAVQLLAFDHDRVGFDRDGARWVGLSPELFAEAGRLLAGLTPRGGTELEEALEQVSSFPAREGRTRSVVLLTDAAVGNEGRLLRRLPELLGGSTRLFVLGVGPVVDRRLVGRLAQAASGTSDVLVPGEDPAPTLARFARRVREGGPVLLGLKLWWEGSGMADVYPQPLPDLYGGEPARLLGRFEGVGPTRLVLTGSTASGKPFRQELPVELPARSAQCPGLGRLWARRRVEHLAEASATDASRAASLRAEGLALSLEHSIVGPFTSLVAEDRVVAVKPRKVRKARLWVEKGPDRGRMLTIDQPRVTVGRISEADLVLRDGGVSRMHFELHIDGDTWRLRDIASTNGTDVNGTVVRDAVLAPGARLTIAETVLRFETSQGDDADAFFEYLPTRRVDVPMRAPAAPAEAASPGAPPPYGGAPGSFAEAERGASFEDDLDALDEECGEPDGAVATMFRGPPGDGRAAASPAPSVAGFAAPRGPVMPAPMAMPAASMARPMAPPSFGAPPSMPTPFAPPSAMSGAMPGGPPSAGGAPPAPRSTGLLGRLAGMIPSGVLGGAPPPAPAPPPARAPMPAGPLPPLPAAPVPPKGYFTGAPPGAGGAPPARPEPPKMERAREESARVHSARPDFTAVPAAPSPVAHGARSQGAAFGIPQSPIEAPGSEPYPEQELQWLQGRLRGELDLVFLVDATGSMGTYIEEVRRRLLELVDALRASPLCRRLRLGLVTYRDHPPQDASYASFVVPLSEDLTKLRSEVQQLQASGGGDGPESVTDGLFDLVRLDWRPGAVKAVVWFGDAPPHGVEPTGDAFPGGCPCGHHWYAQAESCREMGIPVYAIGCLPGLRGFVGAEAVFRTVARTTRGMFLPLREAGLLVPLIAGAAVSELDRERVDLYVEELVRAHGAALAQTDEAERLRWMTEALRAQNIRPRGMAFDPEAPVPSPLRFREARVEDVEGALSRLRAAGRVAL